MAKISLKKRKERAQLVLSALSERYPQPATHLFHSDAWELMVATILSAQCTDARVNMVTPELFSRWRGSRGLAGAELAEVEAVIHSTGFYHNKAKNIIAAAKLIELEFGGEVPRSMAELIRVPGVARKTANVVLFGAYGLNEGLAVDTHVKRICHRLGLTGNTEPVAVERDLMEIFPQAEWGNVNHRLVWFGRHVCEARSPHCVDCELETFCPKLEPK